MSNAKYTTAPTSDPDEFTVPPPSYSTASAGPSSAPYGSAPRTSTDNIPDDFKYGGCVAEATIEIRQLFVQKVYALLSAQLVLTTIISSFSFFSDGYKSWVQNNPGPCFGAMFLSIAFLIATYWKRQSYPINLILLSLFTLCEAYTVSVVISFYEASTVLTATILTAGIFLFLTAFASQTKYDFTSWVPYASGALWALILFGFMGIFLPQTSTSELLMGSAGALIFSVYILIDTQMIMRKFNVEEEISAALQLYLDIINLFLYILRILNSQNDN